MLLAMLVLYASPAVQAQGKGRDHDKAPQAQAGKPEAGKPKPIKFDYVDATKTYPEGNQITYVRVKNLPDDKSLQEYITKYVIEMMRVKRLKIYAYYEMILLDGDADINPEHVVDVMNEAMERYAKERAARHEEKEKAAR